MLFLGLSVLCTVIILKTMTIYCVFVGVGRHILDKLFENPLGPITSITYTLIDYRMELELKPLCFSPIQLSVQLQ